MKLLAVFFLLGLALASAVPYSDDDIESEIDQISDELGDEFIIYAEGGLAQRLRERLEKLIEDIKSRFDKGESVDGNLMKKAEDFYEKLKNFGFEISEKFRKIYEELKEKIRGGNAPEHADFFNFKDLLRKLRERLRGEFDVEKIRDHIENVFGKSEVTNQLLEMIKDKGGKARERIVKFIDRILGEDTQAAEFGFLERLKKQFEEMVEKMKKSFDDGNGVSENLMKKAQDFYEKLKNMRVEVSDKIKEIFEDLKNRMSKNSPQHAFNIKDLLVKLRERLQGEFDVEKIRDHVENIFGKSMITDQLLEMIKGKGEKARQRILDFIDRFLGDRETQFAEFGFLERLKKQFEEMVEKMKKSFDDGNGVSENLMKKAQDFYEKLKNMRVEVSDKIKEIFEDLKNRMNKNSVAHAEHSIAARLKERLENLINRMKKNMDDGKGVRGDLFKKANDVYEKFKNLGFELNEKFKQVFEDLRSKFQRSGTFETERRSIKEIYEKVKKYFEDINIELKEKFFNFGEYVKDQYQRVVDKSKSRRENLKRIAREFLDDAENLSKDMAGEALEFFREYKHDLGTLWKDVKDKVRDIIEEY